MVRVQAHFAVFVPGSLPVYPAGTPAFPLARALVPERRRDEAGTGFTPDIAVPAERALLAALALAVSLRVHVQIDAGEASGFERAALLDARGEPLTLSLHHGRSS